MLGRTLSDAEMAAVAAELQGKGPPPYQVIAKRTAASSAAVLRSEIFQRSQNAPYGLLIVIKVPLLSPSGSWLATEL